MNLHPYWDLSGWRDHGLSRALRGRDRERAAGARRGARTCRSAVWDRLQACRKSRNVYQRAKLKRGDLVFVPYLGSGPDLPAAVAMGLRVLACDVERWCCDTAIGRLGAITPEKAADMRGLPLFER